MKHQIDRRGFTLLGFSLIALTLADITRADEPGKWRLASLDTPKYAVTFADDKRWDVEVLATGLADVTNRHVGMGGMTVGVGYYVLDNLAIQLDVSGYGFSEGHSSGAAAGVTIGLRHHVLTVGKSSIFFDVSFGKLKPATTFPVTERIGITRLSSASVSPIQSGKMCI